MALIAWPVATGSLWTDSTKGTSEWRSRLIQLVPDRFNLSAEILLTSAQPDSHTDLPVPASDFNWNEPFRWQFSKYERVAFSPRSFLVSEQTLRGAPCQVSAHVSQIHISELPKN